VYVILQNHYLRFLMVFPHLRFILAKTPYKLCVIFLYLKFDFRFFPHIRHENSIPTTFWSLILGLKFTTLDFGLHKYYCDDVSGSCYLL
jgi:hypothetical protein